MYISKTKSKKNNQTSKSGAGFIKHHFKENNRNNPFFSVLRRSMKSGAGFTLLEVILAVFVLTIAVSGAFALISQTLVLASLTQSKLIASYLVQEGIEITKNIRDTNWLTQRTDPDILWKDGLDQGGWQIDYKGQRLDYGVYGNFLNIDSEGFYSYSAGRQTFFKRKISITNIDENNIKVVVEVSWRERNRNYQVKALEKLSNWYEQRYR